MRQVKNYSKPMNLSQRGATLIVALVVLAIVSVIALTGVRTSVLEVKLAASHRDQQVAFNNAEVALREVERIVRNANYTLADFMPACNNNERCFTRECTGGRCFTGDFDGADLRDCNFNAEPGVPTIDEKSLFKSSWDRKTEKDSENNERDISLYRTTQIKSANGLPIDVKYLVEFMCFLPRNERVFVVAGGAGAADFVPLLRLTVFAEGDAKRTTTMIQSYIKEQNIPL